MSQSGYYTWLKRPSKSAALSEYIKKQYWKHKARLGAPSLVYDAKDEGYQTSERTISRILQRLGLRSKAYRKFRYNVDIGARNNIVRNTLARQFNPDKPNAVWITDMTYIKTGAGWLYLCVIIDLHGRQVIWRQTSHYINSI